MTQLSEHFTLEEMTFSRTAAKHKADNRPPPEVVPVLESLCRNVLEPIRTLLGCPIGVDSGYRSPWVNFAVGGAIRSQHIATPERGAAADIRPMSSIGLVEAVRTIAGSSIPYDQLILEPGWIHVSWAPGIPRRQVLTGTRDGRTLEGIHEAV